MEKLAYFLIFTVSIARYGKCNELENLSIKELDSIISICQKSGQFKNAIPYLIQGQTIAAQKFGKQDTLYLRYTTNLGYMNKKSGLYQQAEAYYLEAPSIGKSILPSEDPDFATLLNNLAHLYMTTGRFLKAEPIYKKALEIRKKKLGMHHFVATSYNNLGVIYIYMQRYDLAESYIKKAMKIRAQTLGKDHAAYGSDLNNLGHVFYYAGKYEQAEHLFMEGMKIRKNHLGALHPDYAASLNNLASLYHLTKRYAKAELYFLKSLKIERKISGEHHPHVLNTLNNLANFYIDMEQYNKSDSIFQKVLTLQLQLLGKNNPTVANTYYNIAKLYEKMGYLNISESHYKQAIALYKQLYGPNNTLYSGSIRGLSSFYLHTGNLRQATIYIQKALEAVTQRPFDLNISQLWVNQMKALEFESENHIHNTRKALNVLYKILSKADGNNDKLASICEVALHLIKRSKDSYISDKDKIRILKESNDWVQKYLTLLDLQKNPQKAFNIIEFNKSILLYEATKASQSYTLGNLPDSLYFLEKNWLKQIEVLETKLIKVYYDAKDSIRRQLNELHLKMDSLKRHIEIHNPIYIKNRYLSPKITLLDVQNSLDEQSALIEYAIGDSCLTAVFIDRHYVKIKRLPIKISVLKDFVVLWSMR